MAAPRPIPELRYRVATAARGARPGVHRSRQGDSGLEFRAHAPLIDAPDARRLDLHASLRNPFGEWLVRVYAQRVAIPVVVVADLSASMAFEGSAAKTAVLADFVESLAWSAWRNGDRFGFVGCDETVPLDWLLAPTRARGAGPALAARLRTFEPSGRSAHGLRAAHRWLPHQRGLVFLVSDFHLPLAEIDAVLASLAPHDVVPVVLWQAQEHALAASQGLGRVVDPESGAARWVWWRPALRARWIAAQQARRDALMQVFRAHRCAPLVVDGRFDADAVTRHFLA
jgi:uncharacterized protein (DUF58 family)